jgi:hypothetical protein
MRDLALIVSGLLVGAGVIGFMAGGLIAFASRGVKFYYRLGFLILPVIISTFTVPKAIAVSVLVGVALGALMLWGYLS